MGEVHLVDIAGADVGLGSLDTREKFVAGEVGGEFRTVGIGRGKGMEPPYVGCYEVNGWFAGQEFLPELGMLESDLFAARTIGV